MNKLVVFLVAAVLLASLPLSAAPITFHVATNGNDGWSGKSANSMGDDGPFATLDRAQRAVRQAIKDDPGGSTPIEVLIHRGTYRLGKALELGVEDADGRPISWQAAPGEKPVISGGALVANWEKWQGEIYRARSPSGKGVQALFCAAQMQVRARYPKLDPQDPITKGWLFVKSVPNKNNDSRDIVNRDNFHFGRGEFPVWSQLAGAEVAHYYWTDDYFDVSTLKGLDYDQNKVTLQRPAKTYGGAFKPGNRYYFQNVLGALTTPGEYYSHPQGDLYYWPRHSEELNQVTVAFAKSLITVLGKADKPIRNVSIRGLTFMESLGPAVMINGAAQCRIENNLFVNLADRGVFLNEMAEENLIAGNEFAWLGSSAVFLEGQRMGGPDTMTRNIIRNNHIHHTCQVLKREPAIGLRNASQTVVEQNLIHDQPNFGIQWLSGLMLKYFTGETSGGKTTLINGQTVTRENIKSFFQGRNNIIARNHLYNCSMEFADTGALYCWAPGVGNVVRENLVQDTVGFSVNGGNKIRYEAHGIYLDDESDDAIVERNIVVRNGLSGIFIHGGVNCLVKNNLFIDCGAAGIRLDNEYKRIGENRIEGNIIVARDWPIYGIQHWPRLPSTHFTAAGNVYDLGTNAAAFMSGAPFPKIAWLGQGFDRGSIFGDAGLAGVAKGDYSRRSDSAARALGFPDWDVAGIGLLPSFGQGPETETGKAARLAGPKPPPHFSYQILKDHDLAKKHRPKLGPSPKPIAVAVYSAKPIALKASLDCLPAEALSAKLELNGDGWGNKITTEAVGFAAYDEQGLHVVIEGVLSDPKKHDADPAHSQWGKAYGAEVCIRCDPANVLIMRGYASGARELPQEGYCTDAKLGEWSNQVKYVAAVESGKWCGHWMIPLSAMGLPPTENRGVAFNLGVVNYGRNSRRHWVSGYGASFHVDIAGELKLGSK